jgi:hypothetical protein
VSGDWTLVAVSDLKPDLMAGKAVTYRGRIFFTDLVEHSQGSNTRTAVLPTQLMDKEQTKT